MRFPEEYGVVYVFEPADMNAGVTGDSINMAMCDEVTWIVLVGVNTGDGVLTVKSGASAGTETTAETFRYRLANADCKTAKTTEPTNADVYGAETAAATLTLASTTYDHKILLVNIKANEMTVDQPFATLLSAAKGYRV
jgi:hypothetical protein